MKNDVDPVKEVKVPNNKQSIYEIDLNNPNKLYVFDIDVGTMPSGKAAEYIERHKELLFKYSLQNPDTIQFFHDRLEAQPIEAQPIEEQPIEAQPL